MTTKYDPRPQTRVYTQNQLHTPAHADDGKLGFTQPIARRRGVLDGVSMAQVIAGAAAAATSMMLASKIGIAGSVIGAAVSSAVTIICSQLYRHALDASAEKLKNAQMRTASEAAQAYLAGNPVPYDLPGEGSAGAAGPHGAGSRGSGAPVARIAPTKLRARAAAERSATQRKVVIASLVIAVAAVAITAGVILAGTSGEGLGHKVPSLFDPDSQRQAPDTQTAPDGATGAAGADTGAQDEPARDPAQQQPEDADSPAGTGDSPASQPGGKPGEGAGAEDGVNSDKPIGTDDPESGDQTAEGTPSAPDDAVPSESQPKARS